jgi:hypothetical protein
MSRSLAIRARILEICDEKEAMRVDGWTDAMEEADLPTGIPAPPTPSSTQEPAPGLSA